MCWWWPSAPCWPEARSDKRSRPAKSSSGARKAPASVGDSSRGAPGQAPCFQLVPIGGTEKVLRSDSPPNKRLPPWVSGARSRRLKRRRYENREQDDEAESARGGDCRQLPKSCSFVPTRQGVWRRGHIHHACQHERELSSDPLSARLRSLSASAARRRSSSSTTIFLAAVSRISSDSRMPK
jgi:hypothetical protein